MMLTQTVCSLLIIAGAAAQGGVTFAVRNRQKRTNQNFRSSIDTSSISPDLPLKIMIHGWLDRGNNAWIQSLSNAYLDRGQYNVVAVDWNPTARQDYVTASGSARAVGNAIGSQLAKLRNQGLSMKKVHIIGHSLGAQIAGFAGKSISKSAGAKVGWITGLDPAGPLYEVPLQSKGGRLSDQDADVVEVIHTDGGVLGFATPTGTVDFYPNGGTFVQPNCVSFSVNAAVICSHVESTKYYIDAVRKGGVVAKKCGSWSAYLAGQCRGNQEAKYGAEQPPTARGRFYNRI